MLTLQTFERELRVRLKAVMAVVIMVKVVMIVMMRVITKRTEGKVRG